MVIVPFLEISIGDICVVCYMLRFNWAYFNYKTNILYFNCCIISLFLFIISSFLFIIDIRCTYYEKMMVNNSTNINKKNNHLLSQLTEKKKKKKTKTYNVGNPVLAWGMHTNVVGF